MDIKKLALRLSLAVAVCLSLMTGCTRHPTPEEMAILEQQIIAAEAAEKKVEDLENEKATVEAELATQKRSLADHETEFEEIKRRMQERGLK